MFSLVIDNREHALIDTLHTLGAADLSIQALPVGDVMIKCDDEPVLIFERKTTADLTASIKDGRYGDQSMRLNTYGIHTHNIAYIIEGNIAAAGQMIYSALTSIWLYKGFSVLTTTNIKATARLILGILKKVETNHKKGKPMLYTVGATNQPTFGGGAVDNVVKQRKVDNLTPSVFAHLVLCQVPSISQKGAAAILEHFGTLNNVINAVRENASFDEVRMNGRKISKTALDNLKRYLIES